MNTVCPHCNSISEIEDQYEGANADCPTCGRDFILTRYIEQAVLTPKAPKPKTCPSCGSFEHFQKVSVLVDSETSTLTAITKGVGVGLSGGGVGVGVGRATSSGTQKSLIATKLAPPEKPQELKGFLFVGILFVLFGALLLNPELSKTWGIICIAFGAVLIWKAPAIRRFSDWQIKKYEKDISAWNRRWFCKRCGNFSEE